MSSRSAPLLPLSRRAQSSALRTTSWYSGICAAAVMSEGLVVASRGVNLRMEWMSPVSATTTVICFSCSRSDFGMGVSLQMPRYTRVHRE